MAENEVKLPEITLPDLKTEKGKIVEDAKNILDAGISTEEINTVKEHYINSDNFKNSVKDYLTDKKEGLKRTQDLIKSLTEMDTGNLTKEQITTYLHIGTWIEEGINNSIQPLEEKNEGLTKDKEEEIVNQNKKINEIGDMSADTKQEKKTKIENKKNKITTAIDSKINPITEDLKSRNTAKTDLKTFQDKLQTKLTELKSTEELTDKQKEEKGKSVLDNYGKDKDNLKEAGKDMNTVMKGVLQQLIGVFGGSGFLDSEYFKNIAGFFNIDEAQYNEMLTGTLKETFAIKDETGIKTKMIMDAYEKGDETIIMETDPKTNKPVMMSPKKIIETYKNGSEFALDKTTGELKKQDKNDNITDYMKGIVTDNTSMKQLDAGLMLKLANKNTIEGLNKDDLFEIKKENSKNVVKWKEDINKDGKEFLLIQKLIEDDLDKKDDSRIWSSVEQGAKQIEKSSLNKDKRVDDGIYSDSDVRRYVMTALVGGEEALGDKVSYTELVWGDKLVQKKADITKKQPKTTEVKETPTEKTYTIDSKADIRNEKGEKQNSTNKIETSLSTNKELIFVDKDGKSIEKKGSDIGITDNDNKDIIYVPITIKNKKNEDITVYIKKENIIVKEEKKIEEEKKTD